MEIQVNAAHLRKKVLLLGLLAVMLFVAGLAIAQHQHQVRPPVTSATPAVPGVKDDITLTFLDGSAQWDWQPNACATPLKTFVVNAPAVRVILVDDSAKLSLVVAYPAPQADAARAAAKCTRSTADLLCQVSVRAGQGANLDVAIAAALAYALQEDARPKTREAYDARPAWAWENFQPALMKKEGSQWQSCLQLSAAK